MIAHDTSDLDRIKGASVADGVRLSSSEVVQGHHEIQLALPDALRPVPEESVQEMLPAPEVVSEVEVESAIAESQPGDEDREMVAEAKAKITAALRRFARPSKQRAVFDANVAEVAAVGFAPFAVEKSPNFGGSADYLRQLEVAADEVW